MKNEIKTLEIFDTVENFKNTAVEKKECHFIISAKEMKNGLSKLKPIIGKNSLPILETVLISVTEGKVKITASDLENSIVVTVPAETKGKGEICINFAQISGYLATLTEGNLLFSFDFSTNTLILKRDNSISKFVGIAVTDFPKLPETNFVDLLKIPVNYFVQGIEKTFGYTGNDELRPVMMGICLECEKEVLRFVATNAHFLSSYSVKNLEENFEYLQEENFVFILNKKISNVLKTVFKNETGILKMKLSSENSYFKYQNVEIYSRNIDGNYPNWRVVVPSELPNVLKVNRKELIEVTNRVAQSANKTTNAIKLHLNGVCELSASDIDFGLESKEFVKDFNYKGADFEIGFNAQFLVKVLKSISSEKVIVLTSAANKASLILPLEIERQADCMSLLMPIEIRNEETPEPEQIEETNE